jgi:DNA damage-binding protein 1
LYFSRWLRKTYSHSLAIFLLSIDLEPFEMILTMTYASLRVHSATSASDAKGVKTDIQDSAGDAVYRTYLLVGTAFTLPDEDEPTRGRILVFTCGNDGSEEDAATTSNSIRAVRLVTEMNVRGGVYSMCQFYEGKALATVNCKTHICQLTDEGNTGGMKLSFVGLGHHGHILTMFVKSQALRMPATANSSDGAASGPGGQQSTSAAGGNASIPMDVDDANTKKSAASAEKEMLAITGDLMRSIQLVQYYPQHEALEEIARDFFTNWTTAIEMLTDDVYLGAENWNNLFVLRRNTKSQSEEVRCRLDTIGEFHLGEMCNKFMKGSLVMPHSSSSSTNARNSSRRGGAVTSPTKKKSYDGTPSKTGGQSGAATRVRRPAVIIGSQTLFGTVDGTLGCILGLDVRTAAFFSTLERAMSKVVRPVGDFNHQQFRTFSAERRTHPAHGFVDGDLVESFLDMDRTTMDAVVHEMNRDGGWEIDRGVMSSSGAQDGVGATSGEKAESAVDVEPAEYP